MSNRGRGGRGFGRGGRGGHRERVDLTNPSEIMECGTYQFPCQDAMIFKLLDIDKIPMFGSPVFLENKTMIGKIEEIFGRVDNPYFKVNPSDGVKAESFKENSKIYIGSDRVLPARAFAEENHVPRAGKGGRGGAKGGRGGRGGSMRGGPRGGQRGGSRGGQRGGGRGSMRGGSRGGRR